jgi:carboxymethylenebutenolidase
MEGSMTVNTTQNKPGERFAPAASPTCPTAIHTPDDTLLVAETTIPTQGDSMPACFARPKEETRDLPIVIVVQEIFGVHEHIRDICRRLALQGYLAIAPELYFRQGDPNDYDDIPTLFNELVTKVPDAQVMADLDHVACWAARHGGDANRLLLTGFCWGGRIAWLYAAHNPQLKAAVAWYGRLNGDKTLNSPKHPLDIAVDLSAPVLGLYGAKDTGIPLESVESMRQALRAANARAEIVVYPDAGHAFNADYRPSYHQQSAKDGWQRMLAWFAQYGGQKP